jgi:hypothetical protein
MPNARAGYHGPYKTRRSPLGVAQAAGPAEPRIVSALSLLAREGGFNARIARAASRGSTELLQLGAFSGGFGLQSKAVPDSRIPVLNILFLFYRDHLSTDSPRFVNLRRHNGQQWGRSSGG